MMSVLLCWKSITQYDTHLYPISFSAIPSTSQDSTLSLKSSYSLCNYRHFLFASPELKSITKCKHPSLQLNVERGNSFPSPKKLCFRYQEQYHFYQAWSIAQYKNSTKTDNHHMLQKFNYFVHYSHIKPKFHLLRHVTSQHVTTRTTRQARRIVRVVTWRAISCVLRRIWVVPQIWRTTKKQ